MWLFIEIKTADQLIKLSRASGRVIIGYNFPPNMDPCKVSCPILAGETSVTLYGNVEFLSDVSYYE